MNIAELDQITKNLMKKIIGSNERITLKELKGKDIPEFTKNYFNREAETWIREESSMLLSSGRFNYDLPEIRKKFDELYALIKDTANFSRPRLNRVLERSVKLQADFLVQPERTMVQFVFRDEDVITPEEVMDTMKYFLAYEYYYKALEEYFKANKTETISRSKFKNFIEQLDLKAFGQEQLKSAVNVASVVVGFLNLGREKSSGDIEVEILVNAYKDRHLDEYAGKMSKVKEDGKTVINVNQLEAVLTAPEGEAVAESASDEKHEYEPQKEVVSTKNLSSMISEIEDIEEEEVQVASFDDLLVEEDDEDIELPPPPPTEEIKKEKVVEAAAPASGAADQLSDIMAKEMGQATSLEDLYQVIEDKDKKVYVKKLFKKDADAFYAFLNEINKMSQWKAASEYIEDVFYEREVNPYKKEAIALTDAIYSRYFPKG